MRFLEEKKDFCDLAELLKYLPVEDFVNFDADEVLHSQFVDDGA